MRHFIPSEKIFTETNYDASFSVFLNRFFYGYINSLVGMAGHRWFMSISVNIFLWISSCVAIYRIGEITNLNERMRAHLGLRGKWYSIDTIIGDMVGL